METVKEMCGDNRFEVIQRAKDHLIEATNIESSPDEMKVLDSFLFRAWQMGWLRKYEPTLRNATDTNVGDKWVSVDERLPERCGIPVLMVAVNKFGQQAIVKGFSNYDCPSGFLTNEKEYDHIWDAWKVTHWMPLPECPKGE